MSAPDETGEPARWNPTDPEPSWLTADRRPEGVDDATVEAVGKLGEAMEWVERARGRLYDFHQMMGHADLLAGEAAELLRACGQDGLADDVEEHLVGRNVLEGRWTFQIVEEFDATYHATFRDGLRHLEDELLDGRPHVFESEMKEDRRTRGRRHHEQRPPEAG
ncbi:MAG TPA: hypothetical protein DCS55_19420 [Acidimicrobiaceae bacterium]|nr:hypothetical protein [Acidimicrobiaceae bacterium]